MNRLIPSILLCALSTACTRTDAASSASEKAQTPPATAGVKVEVVSKKRMQSLDGEIFVRFRVVNGSAGAIAYPGFAEYSPTFSLELQEGGAWSSYAIGWCGTGLIDFTLRPGAEMSFDVGLPADGKTYRASFGDPPVVTPPVVAEAP